MTQATREPKAARFLRTSATTIDAMFDLCVELIRSSLLLAEREGIDIGNIDAARAWLRAERFGEGAIIAFLEEALHGRRSP